MIYTNFISLFDKAEEPITININENIKYANPAFIRMLGYESENEILKLGLFNIVSDRYITKIKNYYKMRLKGDIVPNIHDLELKRADGSTILIECVHYCMPFKDLNLIICFYIDLHKIKSLEKKLRESEEKYHSLFKSSIEGVLISDNEGKFSSVNPAAASLLGYDGPEEMIGMPALNIYIDPSRREPIIKGMTETGYLKDFEIQLKKKDGTPIDTIFNATLHKDEDGNLLRIEAFFRDITERKKADEKILKEKNKAQSYLDLAGVLIIALNKEGNITLINKKGCEVLGYSEEELIGKQWFKTCIPPRFCEPVFKDFKRLVGGDLEPIEFYENPILTKSGEERIIAWHNSLLYDNERNIIGTLTSGEDITERKKMEETLRESEEKWRSLTEYSSDYIFTVDLDYNISFINQTVLGITKEEIIGKQIYQFVPEDYQEAMKRCYERVLNSSKPDKYYFEYLDTDGTKYFFESRVAPRMKDAEIIGFTVNGTDITERKKTEEELKTSEKRFRTIAENFPNGAIILYDHDLRYLLAEGEVLEKVGLTSEKMVGTNLRDLVTDEYYNAIAPYYKAALNGETHRFEFEFGGIVFDITILPIKDSDGNIIAGMAISQDITERKKIEEELRLHSEIMTNMAEGVYLIRTNDGIITYTNPKFEKMFGYKQGEMIGKNVSIVNAPTDKDPREIAKEIMEILERTGEWHGEVKNIKKDGTPFWCYANVSVFDHPEFGEVLVSVHTDITDRKRAEQRLKESEEKYRDAYDMANFYKDLFAHDINNILNNIKSSGELISLYLNNPEKFKDMERLLGIIKDQVNRGAKLISNVQKLSQLEENEIFIKSMEICKLLREAIQFTHKSFPTKNISIQIESIGKKLFVQANTLLLDVFENLLNNDVKFNENHRVEILIRISKFQKKGIKSIKIEFMDNGMGITDDRKKLVFQKTYKKDISLRGMGFGLSLVKKIIDSYNGEVWIEDNVIGDYTKGSNFIILIPEVV